MLLAGGTISGREAAELGLATHLAERDRLDLEADELARRLAEGGPYAIAATKRWVNELDGSLDDEVFERAAKLSADVLASPEARSRLRARFGDKLSDR